MSGGMAFGGANEAEKSSMMGSVSDLASGMKQPVVAFFHILFKVRATRAHAAAARPLTHA